MQKKKILGGIFIHLTFFATTGNPAPPIEAMKTMTVTLSDDSIPQSLKTHLQTAATCSGKSYAAPSASLPHTGFSMVDIVKIITTDKNAQEKNHRFNPELPAALSPATVENEE